MVNFSRGRLGQSRDQLRYILRYFVDLRHPAPMAGTELVCHNGGSSARHGLRGHRPRGYCVTGLRLGVWGVWTVVCLEVCGLQCVWGCVDCGVRGCADCNVCGVWTVVCAGMCGLQCVRDCGLVCGGVQTAVCRCVCTIQYRCVLILHTVCAHCMVHCAQLRICMCSALALYGGVSHYWFVVSFQSPDAYLNQF